MNNNRFGTMFWYFAKTVLLIDLLVFVVSTLICWWFGWRTLNQIGFGFMIGGFVAILFGGASFMGGVEIAKNPTYRYVQSVFPNSLHERTKQNLLDLNESSGFLILMGTAGLLAIVIGWLITKFIS